MKRAFRNIKQWLNRISRKRAAAKFGVPFRQKMWYNYRAMLPKDKLSQKSFIEIFDKDGQYIVCPPVGGEVVYNNKGKRFLYRIVDFDNESPNRDWLYDSDWINPIVEFIEKIEDET